MKKCYIITAYIDGIDKSSDSVFFDDIKKDMKDAFVICADGGLEYADLFGIVPDLIVGDFDSYKGVIPYDDIEIYRAKPIKDDTDTGLCMKIAAERGFEDIIIVGGCGGRLSHTLANLQIMADKIDEFKSIVMRDLLRFICVIKGPTEISLNKNELKLDECEKPYLSVFSHSDTAKGVFIKGAFYTLNNVDLDNVFPIGVSNEFVDDTVNIGLKEGVLQIVVDY